ncbi:MAG: toll/interleukin-1 receptor domain-containing protein [Hyphomonadaceae bacterium]
MADVFISYKKTRERRALVQRLALLLHVHNVSVWWDNSLEAGVLFEDPIERELRRARLVLPLWCTQSIHSKWVFAEASQGRKKLLPAILQPVRPPAPFTDIHAHDLSGWDGDVRNEKALALVRLICSRLRRNVALPTAIIGELASLPQLTPLPSEDPDQRTLLTLLRQSYMEHFVTDIDDANSITLESPIDELIGAFSTPEEFESKLNEITAERELCVIVDADDSSNVSTVGDLINLAIERYRDVAGDDGQIQWASP